MKKILILTLFITTNIFSQVVFESGYFITNSSEKVNCLIKHLDWLNNPTEFYYKLVGEGEIKQESIDNVTEFVVNGKVKFLRAKVDLDISSNDINKLDINRSPNFISKEVFLKVLIEGRASLFSYVIAGDENFFYMMDDSSIKPLVHKLFFVDEKRDRVSSNDAYKQELLNNLQCLDINESRIKKLSYKRDELIDLFTNYNGCIGVDFKNYNKKNKAKRDLFNLSFRAGLRNNSFNVKRDALNRELDFGSILSYRIGLEAEIILGFNNNKWAIIIEPTIQNFRSSKKTTDLVAVNMFNTNEAELDFSSIEIPVGIRHYFFLNENLKLFANALYSFDVSNDSKIDFDTVSDLEVFRQGFAVLGAGLVFKKKINFELRHGFNRDNFWNNENYNSNYSNLSFIIGYNFF